MHALVIAALVWGTPRWSGPASIGVTASLKIAPIIYALIYIGRRQWGRLILSVAIAAFLWAPALLYDLENYPTDPGDSFSALSLVGPVPWLLLVGIFAVGAIAFARTRHAWVAGSVAVISAVPRLALYDLTYLLVWRDNQRGSKPVTRWSSRSREH